jgi:hypothetical protein
VALRHRFADALAFGRPSVAPGQIGAYAAFIDKDQVPLQNSAQFGLKAPTRPLGFGPVSFYCRECLFFCGRPKAFSVRESTGTLVIRR